MVFLNRPNAGSVAITLSILVIMLVLVGLGIGIAAGGKLPKPAATPLTSGNQKININTFQTESATNILEVHLRYNRVALPQVSLVGIDKKVGFAPRYLPKTGAYTLKIFNTNKQLAYSLGFIVPNQTHDDGPLVNPTSLGQTILLDQVNFALTVLAQPNQARLDITDPAGKVVGSMPL